MILCDWNNLWRNFVVIIKIYEGFLMVADAITIQQGVAMA